MKGLFKKQNELYKRQYDLSDLKAKCNDYKEHRKIAKAQNEVYKKYIFYKNLNKAIKEVEKNDNQRRDKSSDLNFNIFTSTNNRT